MFPIVHKTGSALLRPFWSPLHVNVAVDGVRIIQAIKVIEAKFVMLSLNCRLNPVGRLLPVHPEELPWAVRELFRVVVAFVATLDIAVLTFSIAAPVRVAFPISPGQCRASPPFIFILPLGDAATQFLGSCRACKCLVTGRFSLRTPSSVSSSSFFNQDPYSSHFLSIQLDGWAEDESAAGANALGVFSAHAVFREMLDSSIFGCVSWA